MNPKDHKSPRDIWLGIVIAIGLPVLGGAMSRLLLRQGAITIERQILYDIGTVALALILALGFLAVSYYRRDLPRQRIEWAIKNNRKICHCTETGIVMLQAKGKTPDVKDYFCPRCRNREVDITTPPNQLT